MEEMYDLFAQHQHNHVIDTVEGISMVRSTIVESPRNRHNRFKFQVNHHRRIGTIVESARSWLRWMRGFQVSHQLGTIVELASSVWNQHGDRHGDQQGGWGCTSARVARVPCAPCVAWSLTLGSQKSLACNCFKDGGFSNLLKLLSAIRWNV